MRFLAVAPNSPSSLSNSPVVRARGLGPTMLISPLRTLRNWGNSSSDKRRSRRPTLVTRGSFLALKKGPFSPLWAWRLPILDSAPSIMVRNL